MHLDSSHCQAKHAPRAGEALPGFANQFDSYYSVYNGVLFKSKIT